MSVNHEPTKKTGLEKICLSVCERTALFGGSDVEGIKQNVQTRRIEMLAGFSEDEDF